MFLPKQLTAENIATTLRPSQTDLYQRLGGVPDKAQLSFPLIGDLNWWFGGVLGWFHIYPLQEPEVQVPNQQSETPTSRASFFKGPPRIGAVLLVSR